MSARSILTNFQIFFLYLTYINLVFKIFLATLIASCSSMTKNITLSGEVYFSSDRALDGLSDIYMSVATEITDEVIEEVEEEVIAVTDMDEEDAAKDEPPVMLTEKVEPEKEETEKVEAEKPEIVLPKTEIVYFEFEKSSLSATAKRKIDKVAELIQEKEAIHVILEDHTDIQGHLEYNKALSQ